MSFSSDLRAVAGSPPAASSAAATVAGPAFATLALHAGRSPDPATGAMLPPIYQTVTYAQAAVGEHRGYTYSRSDNPTVAALEARLAALERGKFCSAFSSGLSATTALFLALLEPGDRVVCGATVYGGTVRLLRELFAPLGIAAEFVDAADEFALRCALQTSAQLLFVESPANPTLRLTDLALAARLAHGAGALLAVDNTLLSPALQQPFNFGADLILHSTTKFIEGHNAAVGGAIVTNDPGLNEKLRWTRNATGSIQSPFNAWLTLQGLKTLPARLNAQVAGAQKVAEFLAAHPAVARVSYPGLPDFPQRELAKRQQTGGGALIAFELRGGEFAGRKLMAAVRLCTLAENLGAVETLITHPATMTHAAAPEAQRQATGITGGLIRLSVGLEAPEDLIADLAQALAQSIGGAL